MIPRLPDPDFDRLMQAAEPVPVPDRNAVLGRVAVDLGHEVGGPGLLHRIINENQPRSALTAKTHCGHGRE